MTPFVVQLQISREGAREYEWRCFVVDPGGGQQLCQSEHTLPSIEACIAEAADALDDDTLLEVRYRGYAMSTHRAAAAKLHATEIAGAAARGYAALGLNDCD